MSETDRRDRARTERPVPLRSEGAGGDPVPPREPRSAVVRRVLVIGSPIVLSNLLAWVVGFTDVLMVSRLGEAALAGLGMATQVFFLVVIAILAVTTGTMVLVARYAGAGDPGAVAHVTRQSLLLAAAQSLVIAAAGVALSPALLALLGAEGEVARAGTLFLRVQFIGVAAPILDFTIASVFRGTGDTLTPLRVTAGVAALNVVLDWLLIFGPGPFPELGIAGAAWATVGARSVGALWGWTLLRPRVLSPVLAPGDPRAGWRPDGALMRRILRVGVPSAVEGMMRAGSGVAFLGIVARTTAGATAVAAHTVGLQMESFARMPSFGISVGATTLVGQRLGAGDPDGAERVGWTSVGVGLALLSAVGLGLFAAARPLATLFSDDPRTVGLAADYLRILALAQPAFLVAVVVAGGLRGGGDPRYPMWVSLFSGWIFLLPFAYWLAVTLGLGPRAAWAAQAANYAISAVLLSLRFRGGRWRTMTV